MKKSGSSRPEVFYNKGFWKIRKIDRKTSALESLLIRVTDLLQTYFVKLCWMAAFENHVHLNSMEQFTKFQSGDANQKLRITFWK